MLEIIFMAILYGVLRKKLVKKGRSTGLAWLGPGLWLAGEFAGAIVGIVIILSQNRGTNISIFDIYPYALPGAVLGAIVAYLIVSSQTVQQHVCPSCEVEFAPRPDRLNRSTCPNCGAIMRVMGNTLLLVRKGKEE